MEVTISSIEKYYIVKINGRVDTLTAPKLETDILNLINDDKNIIIDLDDMDYISSSGLRVLLLTQKKLLAKSKSLKLFGLQASIKEIFDISGFSSIFKIYQDFNSATK